jgi:hypothetical protein
MPKEPRSVGIRLFALILGAWLPCFAQGTLHVEPIRWFGLAESVMGTPIGSPVGGPDGLVYGVTRRPGSKDPDIIYRWSPKTRTREIVARVPDVNMIVRDGENGLFVSTLSQVVTVSTSGVVRELISGATFVGGAVEDPSGWIYAVTYKGGWNGTGYAVRVRRDHSDSKFIDSFSGYPYGCVGVEELGPPPLRLDRAGRVHGILGPGHWTWGGWLGGGGHRRGNSGMFLLTTNPWISERSLPTVFALDAVQRPDGTYAVITGHKTNPLQMPHILHRYNITNYEYKKVSEAPTNVALLPGIVLGTNGIVYAVTSAGANTSTRTNIGGIVHFPPNLNRPVWITPFPVETDPLFTLPTGGLTEVDGFLYGHAKGPVSGGCLYRMDPSGKIENVLSFEPYETEPGRQVVHGPIILGPDAVVVPTQDAGAPVSLKPDHYRPSTRSWDPMAVTWWWVDAIDRNPGITRGTNGLICLVQEGHNGQTNGLGIAYFSPDLRILYPLGWLPQPEPSPIKDQKGLILASDGYWYGVSRAAHNRDGTECVYRFKPPEQPVRAFSRFPANDSAGHHPIGAVVESDNGWLYGITAKGAGGSPLAGLFRVPLRGGGIEPLGTLPGTAVGGAMKGRDGNLYCLLQPAGAMGGVMLARIHLQSHTTTVIAEWPESRFGKLNLQGPPTQGPDHRFYATGTRTEGTGTPLAVIVSAGELSADPRLDLELQPDAGSDFVPPLAVGSSGWMYAATKGGGPVGQGGVLRLRPRPTLRATAQAVEVRAFASALSRLESAPDPAGPWTVQLPNLTMDAEGMATVPQEPSTTPRYFRAVLLDNESL